MKDLPLSKRGGDLASIMDARIVFLDGAMGTMIQREGLVEADFHKGCPELENSSHRLSGNNDLLSVARPDILKKIHKSYFLAGSDIVTTCTFGANRIVQSEYGISNELTAKLNARAVGIAKEAAAEAKSELESAGVFGRDFFVAGSVGPMNKSASISSDINDPSARSVNFDELRIAYEEQMDALLSAGADLLLLETSIDTLNVKAAIYAYLSLSERRGERVPIGISMTVSDASGRILSGQTIDAFYASVRHANPMFVGLNCSLGAEKMRPYVEAFDRIAECGTHCYPNAGLPNPLSESGYDQSPAQTAEYLSLFCADSLLNVVGGCCGTTPAHISAIVEACSAYAPRRPRPKRGALVLSGLEAFAIDDADAPFVFVGERANVTGSMAFRKMIREGRFGDALEVARRQVENGANILDINFDEAMLDSASCMRKFVNLIASEPEIARVPLMIDSSDFDTILSGLKCAQGKCVVNSISLKEGEEKFLERAREIKKYGAAVVVMAFDERGQAVSREDRVSVCRRAYGLLTEGAGYDPEDIIFDANVLAVATGIAEHDSYALDFIEAVREIKRSCPKSRTSAGVSNISFALRGNNRLREAMHSVFLYHARAAGLDMGIVNAGMLSDYDSIEPELREAVEDVVLNRFSGASDKLLELAEKYKGGLAHNADADSEEWESLPWNDRLLRAFIKGQEARIDEITMHFYDDLKDPLAVIEGPLMGAMKHVGELFGAGKMFLPQVVKSARVMKKAVSVLEPYMEAKEHASGPKVVLATVKGDVHDIGKNIVAVVLACNGFRVVDLGVMVEAETILEAARDAAIVGLSGLITPSLDEMANVLKTFERAGLRIPVNIGGATTSDLHTAVKLAPLYSGTVVRTADAGLSAGVCSRLVGKDSEVFALEIAAKHAKIRSEYEASEKKSSKLLDLKSARARAHVEHFKNSCKKAPFEGARIFEVPIGELEGMLQWASFFRTWQLNSPKSRRLEDIEKTEALAEFARDILDILGKLSLCARPKLLIEFFGACRNGDDIELYRGGSFVETLRFVRSQVPNSKGECLCLSDFVPPKASAALGNVALFAATVGNEAENLALSYRDSGDSYRYLVVQSLCDMFADALSLYSQRRIFKCAGIRPAVGYPSYPDHSEKAKFERILSLKDNLSISLSENFMMTPKSSICGLWIPGEGARYFNACIASDQLADYASRTSRKLDDVEKYMAFKVL